MTYRRFAYSLLISLGLYLGLSLACNMYFDFYDVFQINQTEKTGINSNQRFRKIQHLSTGNDYNAYLFGSSRTGHFDVDYLQASLNRHDEGLSMYNMGVFSGTPADYLKMLKYFKKTGQPVDHVLIGLDYYSFYQPPDLTKLQFKHHYEVSGETPFSFYSTYLLQSGFVYLVSRYNYYFGDEVPPYRYNYVTGTHQAIQAVRDYEFDPELYWQEQSEIATKGRAAFVKTKRPPSQQALLEAKALFAWLEANKIDYKAFVQPMHPLNKAYYVTEQHELIRAYVADLAGDSLVDLKSLNCLLEDNHNFYDMMHYRENVANAIVDVVYSGQEPGCQANIASR